MPTFLYVRKAAVFLHNRKAGKILSSCIYHIVIFVLLSVTTKTVYLYVVKHKTFLSTEQ